jgi:hypothetical protein
MSTATPRHKAIKLPRTRVRCLGPRKGEHWFMSLDASNRICPECRKKQDTLHVSPNTEVPVRTGE